VDGFEGIRVDAQKVPVQVVVEITRAAVSEVSARIGAGSIRVAARFVPGLFAYMVEKPRRLQRVPLPCRG